MSFDNGEMQLATRIGIAFQDATRRYATFDLAKLVECAGPTALSNRRVGWRRVLLV